jgi:hypothetical protein
MFLDIPVSEKFINIYCWYPLNTFQRELIAKKHLILSDHNKKHLKEIYMWRCPFKVLVDFTKTLAIPGPSVQFTICVSGLNLLW